jgi:hypothetical protein
VDDDRRPLARAPALRPPSALAERLRAHVAEPLERWLGGPRPGPARNVNALGEVPDSTWFTNRNHLRRRTAAELRRGAATGEGPSLLAPWRVLAAGVDPGGPHALVEDEQHQRFTLRFDHPAHPRLATTAELVATLLLHALGYAVPARHLVVLAPDQLRFPVRGPDRRSAARDRAAFLAGLPRLGDGSVRAVATAVTPGRRLGPFAFHGRRPDDPNDRVPHELRRELRGLGPVAAWLSLTGIADEVPEDVLVVPGRHVVHTLHHLRGALGSTARGTPKPLREGYEPGVSLAGLARGLLTLGAWPRAASRLRDRRAQLLARHPGLGWLDDQGFRAAGFRPRLLAGALAAADDRDRHWGARLVASVDDEQLRAVIAEADLPAGEAARLLAVLAARRRSVVATFLGRRAPLEGFEVRGEALCFTDRWRGAGLGRPGAVRYDHRTRRLDGTLAAVGQVTGTAAGGICLPDAGGAVPPGGYGVVEIRRPDVGPAWVEVHLRRRGGRLALAGLAW